MARTNEALWEKAKAEAKAKMGGKHSARAMQLAGKIYKDKGGKYSGKKTEAQKSLTKWTKEEWGTKSGKPSTEGPKATGERYLPKKAREALSQEEYKRTSEKKREDLKKGKQFSSQPKAIAEKTAKYRK
jgi:phospholipase/lecithinase/hemolysin